MAESSTLYAVRLGIRAQLVLWLGALLVLAFVPLFFVVAGPMRASLRTAWEHSSRSLGRAIAGHVSEARRVRQPRELASLLKAQIGQGVGAIAVYDEQGRVKQQAGEKAVRLALPSSVTPAQEQVVRVDSIRGAAIVVIVPGFKGSVGTLVYTDPRAIRVLPVVRLVALYVGLLGLTLLVFSYLVLTRVVVTPIDQLRGAAARVADGGRTLVVPMRGSRELLELGSSLSTMTAKLRADEEKLRGIIDELRAKTQELREAQETVMRSERLASVGRLAAGLAHEIGNPIAAILSFQELLLDRPNIDEVERDFLVRMNKETERVNRIMRDLLDFARPAAQAGNAVTPSMRDGDVCASVGVAIEHVVQLVRPQRTFADVELITTLEGDLPAVCIGPEHLEQVLVNLLMNAADAVPKPGGLVNLTAEADETHIEIAVEDNGGGVDAAIRDQLFEPFVTTKEVGKGTGLGLAVCRGLIRAAGGTIHIEDGVEGARFIIRLARMSPPD